MENDKDKDMLSMVEQMNQKYHKKIDVPYDIVKLPSCGKLHKDLPAEIRVEYVTAVDEDLLTSPKLLQSGKALDILIERKTLDKIDIKKLCRGDKDRILIDLYCLSYGSDYDIRFIDPKTEKPFDYVIKLDELKNKDLTVFPDNDGLFSFTLPISKKELKFRFLTDEENDFVIEAAEQEAIKMKSDIVHYVTRKLKAQIMEIDGNKDKMNISEVVDKMIAGDSKKLRNYIRSIEPGVDLSVSVTTPSGGTIPYYINIDSNFFWMD